MMARQRQDATPLGADVVACSIRSSTFPPDRNGAFRRLPRIMESRAAAAGWVARRVLPHVGRTLGPRYETFADPFASEVLDPNGAAHPPLGLAAGHDVA